MPRLTDRSEDTPPTVQLGHVLSRSPYFKALFSEGMALVEEAAAYLDGAGRIDSRLLPPALAAAYSAESMRLTTRLMQVASWLLIRRAVVDGEMTPSEAQVQRVKVTLSAQNQVSTALVFAQLPEALRRLTERSLRIQTRVLHLDRMVGQPADRISGTVNSDLERQRARLLAAYPTFS